MVRKLALILSLVASAAAGDDETICLSPTKTFHVTVDLFAGELGYMKIDECGDRINPTIGMEFNETYTFIQKDLTNYYHPVGFSYAAFGDQEIHAEVEPTVTRVPGATCDQDASCPAPMYFLNDEYLGKYNNLPELGPKTTGEEDFGLDVYEPMFFRPPPVRVSRAWCCANIVLFSHSLGLLRSGRVLVRFL